jgi:hypothetical protein
LDGVEGALSRAQSFLGGGLSGVTARSDDHTENAGQTDRKQLPHLVPSNELVRAR